MMIWNSNISNTMEYIYIYDSWGFHSHGGSPVAGWLRENPIHPRVMGGLVG